MPLKKMRYYIVYKKYPPKNLGKDEKPIMISSCPS